MIAESAAQSSNAQQASQPQLPSVQSEAQDSFKAGEALQAQDSSNLRAGQPGTPCNTKPKTL